MTLTADQFLSRKDLAKIFSVTQQTIIRLEKAGKLPRIQIAGRVRYRKVDVESFIQSATTLHSQNEVTHEAEVR